MNDFILTINNLCYTYEDGTNALNGINLEIKPGEKIAIMGSNGSGKSTFFLCLNGIKKPKNGYLSFHGSPYDYSKKGLLDLRSKVGIVFQDPDNQLFSASVFQEISFGILNLGVDAIESRTRVEAVIDDLDITSFRHKPTHFLSGGQKKQVSLADILVMKPEVIILDEPTSALDPKHTKMIYDIINELSTKGITVILSTHDVNHAFKWADTIAVFHNGTILQKGTPIEIFNNTKLIEKSNLEIPTILKLFNKLCTKNILRNTLPIPRAIEELEKLIDDLHYIKET